MCGITGAVRVRMILQTQPGNRPRYSIVLTLNRPGCPSSAVNNAFTYHRCDPSLIDPVVIFSHSTKNILMVTRSFGLPTVKQWNRWRNFAKKVETNPCLKSKRNPRYIFLYVKWLANNYCNSKWQNIRLSACMVMQTIVHMSCCLNH